MNIKKTRGLMQIPLIIGLMAVAVAIPIIRNISAKKKPVAEVPKQEVVKKEKKIEANIFLEPKENVFKIGERKKIKIIIDTSQGNRKVDIARVVVCWSGGLKIADLEKDITLDKDFFDGFVFKNPIKLAGLDCLDVVANSQRKTTDLRSGKMTLAEIFFIGTEKLENGMFTIESESTEVSGPANANGEYGIYLGSFEKFAYKVD
jgi:hypothetical protein